MAAKTGKLTANGARKKFLRRDFEVQMGVGDVTSPIAVLGVTDFGNNWGERVWDRISGQRGTQLGAPWLSVWGPGAPLAPSSSLVLFLMRNY